MSPTEPLATALFLVALGALLAASALASRFSGRVGVPFALVFLLIGVVAGSEGLGGIAFDDYGVAFRLGTLALVLILFDGGLNTPLASVREAIRPAAMLATVGVAGTAALGAVAARAVGFPWMQAFLLGAVVSSTDAAAVFSVLRNSGIHLRRRVGLVLELESGLNDPMAVILTLALTAALVEGRGPGWGALAEVPVQLLVGTAIGTGVGLAGRWVMARTRLAAAGLYPVLTTALALVAFGAPTLVAGSGFLAVYAAAVVLGNARLPYQTGIRRVHDALAWFSQVAMFLLLGLLVYPTRLASAALPGLAIGAFLTFVARPLVVGLCLAPFRYPAREVAYVGWVGLRGAVPIILATYPVLAGAEGAGRIFDVVFFIVVVNAVVPGGTVGWVTRRLRLEAAAAPPPAAVLEIASAQPLADEIMSFYVEPASAVSGSAIADLPFPPGSAVMLIVRGTELVAAKGATTLEPGDHVYVFSPPADKPFLSLLFGREEQA